MGRKARRGPDSPVRMEERELAGSQIKQAVFETMQKTKVLLVWKRKPAREF